LGDGFFAFMVARSCGGFVVLSSEFRVQSLVLICHFGGGCR